MQIALIPARGGSKRIPRKNIRPFAGRPMIGWPIAAARASGLFDHVIVSTDDEEIAEVARAAEDGLRTPAGKVDLAITRGECRLRLQFRVGAPVCHAYHNVARVRCEELH